MDRHVACRIGRFVLQRRPAREDYAMFIKEPAAAAPSWRRVVLTLALVLLVWVAVIKLKMMHYF
jgi:hypothetical protein